MTAPHSQGRKENPGRSPAPVIIHPLPGKEDSRRFKVLVLAMTVSFVTHFLVLPLFFLLHFSNADALPPPAETVIESRFEEDARPADFETDQVGLDPEALPANDKMDRTELAGIEVGPLTHEGPDVAGVPDRLVSPQAPPGFPGVAAPGGGLSPASGMGNGPAGLMIPGGFGLRTGGARQKSLKSNGGTSESEVAVTRGLYWLHFHQDPDGKWSLDGFNQHSLRETSPNVFVRDRCNCTGPGKGGHNVAGTGLGLLPFLGAGYTHKGNGEAVVTSLGKEYARDVERGLKYLILKQNAQGDFGEGMYSQGIATIAVCEAYGLTSDPLLKRPAQKALNFIARAQSAAGGWSYTAPCIGHDTSVGGWQLMALKSGQLSGLDVPARTLQGASRWLDGVANPDGSGYGYQGPSPTPTMTAVGLLCREYLGWGPRNPALIKGIEQLKKTPPQAVQNMYYYYYATQVMHHVGNEAWEFWNPKMRDWLVATQDKGGEARHPHQRGSWDPKPDQWGADGGRVMVTSLSVLTLEVYYRHLPLYRRDLGEEKP